MSQIVLNLEKSLDQKDFKDRFTPGIHDCEIVSIGVKETKSTNLDYISMIVTDLQGSCEHEERFFVHTEGAMKATIQRIIHIYEAIYGKDNFDKGDTSVEKLNKNLAGRKIRFKFVGEEYEYNGETRLRAGFPFMNFAESMSVPMESSRLRFDKERDIKKLPTEVAESVSTGPVTPPTNLKF